MTLGCHSSGFLTNPPSPALRQALKQQGNTQVLQMRLPAVCASAPTRARFRIWPRGLEAQAEGWCLFVQQLSKRASSREKQLMTCIHLLVLEFLTSFHHCLPISTT